MNEDHPDLKGLDPSIDMLHWERMVRGITVAAEPELERRRALATPLLLVSEWRRPALALSATIAAMAASILMLISVPDRDDPELGAAGMGVPVQIEEWLTTGYAPAIEELFYGIEGGI